MYVSKVNIGFIEVPNCITLDIYAVGCKHNCQGCHNPQLQNFDYKYKFNLKKDLLYEKLIKSDELLDGVCWLGGDVCFQQESYIELSKFIKDVDLKLFNCMYTGFLFDDLSEDMKQYTDVIIDGKWNGKMVSEKGTNQRIFIKKYEKWKLISYGDAAEENPSALALG